MKHSNKKVVARLERWVTAVRRADHKHRMKVRSIRGRDKAA